MWSTNVENIPSRRKIFGLIPHEITKLDPVSRVTGIELDPWNQV